MQAVLFDLDGTLLDTIGDIHKTLNESLQKFSYPTISLEQAREYVGNGAEALVRRAVPEGMPWEEVYSDYYYRFAETDNALTAPYDGTVAVLSRLKEAGVKIAVVTNKPQEATKNVLKDKLSEIEFDLVMGDSGTFPRKPDPTLARFASLSLRVPLAECVVVGDGETDVLTAKNAGMRSIACLWGYRTKEQLQEAGATQFVSSWAELEKVLFA